MLVILGLVGAGCSGGGGLAAKDACKQSAMAFCERALRCEGSTGYVSLDDCAIHMQARTCSGASDICGAGQTYHAEKAQSCVNAMRDLACDSQSTPAVCDEVCTDSNSPFGGETVSIESACKRMGTVYCQKAFACGPDSPLSSYASQYDSETECASSLEAMCLEDRGGCDSGETFHGDKANQCLTEYSALACTELDDQPVACEQVCTDSSDTGGSGLSGISYQELCRRMFAAICDRCYETLNTSSTAECLSKYQGTCAEVDASVFCPTGTYQPSKGMACVNSIENGTSCTGVGMTSACQEYSLCR
jgi:hypothetical protein